MSTAKKTKPELWSRVVDEIRNSSRAGPRGTWNARKAQLAVKEYKSRGGDYVGRRSRSNSLAKWTREDWGYIDDKPGNRYLPRGVRDKLTPREKRVENSRKKSATRSGRQRASYSKSVSRKMRSRGVY